MINGKKQWITNGRAGDVMILVTRTTPRDEVERGTDGFSRLISTSTRATILSPGRTGFSNSKSCERLEDVRVPEENLLGEKTTAGGPWSIRDPGTSRLCRRRTGIGNCRDTAEYASDREVFDAPIGSHPAVSLLEEGVRLYRIIASG